MAEKVKAVAAHNQSIDGKKVKPGDTVTLEPALARILVQRGAVQIKQGTTEQSKPAPAATKEASK